MQAVRRSQNADGQLSLVRFLHVTYRAGALDVVFRIYAGFGGPGP